MHTYTYPESYHWNWSLLNIQSCTLPSVDHNWTISHIHPVYRNTTIHTTLAVANNNRYSNLTTATILTPCTVLLIQCGICSSFQNRLYRQVYTEISWLWIKACTFCRHFTRPYPPPSWHHTLAQVGCVVQTNICGGHYYTNSLPYLVPWQSSHVNCFTY